MRLDESDRRYVDIHKELLSIPDENDAKRLFRESKDITSKWITGDEEKIHREFMLQLIASFEVFQAHLIHS